MKFWLSLMFEPPGDLLAHARLAEELGFEGVTLPDHIMINQGNRTPHPSGYDLDPSALFPDPLLAFSAMASVTTRLRFMTYVYVVPLRDPFVLAKQCGTLSVMSNNRFVLGTGVGWLKEEFEMMGKDFSTRGKRTDEMFSILRDFWDDGFAEADGEFFSFPRSGMFPVPERQIPMWIGGHSIPAAKRAVNYDGYIPMRAVVDPLAPMDEQSRAEFEMIDRSREERGLTSPFVRAMTAVISNAGEARKLEEEDGVSHVLVTPWQASDYSQSFDEKKGLATRFAEQVIHAA